MRLSLKSMLCGVSVVGMYLASAQFMPSHFSANAQAEEIAQATPLEEVNNSVDPYEPVEILIVNNTSIDLFAAISGGTRVELAPQEMTQFQFESTPISVFVYPTRMGSTLKFNTNFENNFITVEVTQVEDAAPGYRAINIEPSGNAYIF